IASFVHFAHNAEYLAEYPNLPASLTRVQVYAVWVGTAALGVLGYGLLLKRRQLLGLGVLAVYAAIGFDGLLHYTRAPLAAHTGTMNLTIWSEVVAAALALAAVLALWIEEGRGRAPAR
ncbi:MAG TPA: hypothetical protein VM692_15600, partial [Gammaproteobacteria bacterium]|nr:hypothetical protein [Gammaproteobacteria bacterium]